MKRGFHFDNRLNNCHPAPALRAVSTILLAGLLSALTPAASGFALLGPFKNRANNAPDPWQGKPYGGLPGGLGYELQGDIGGPMFPHEAYRWNIPVIYYGFDRTFVDYFGQPGIDAVESAIAILNALPPVSAMSAELAEFPLDVKSRDAAATSLNLIDLKSYTLSLLLEQLGLANPERFVWGLRARQVISSQNQLLTNYTVVRLNFDPLVYSLSQTINGARYNYQIFDGFGPTGGEWASAAEWFQLDPLYEPYSSVAGGLGSADFQLGDNPDGYFWWSGLSSGEFYTGLTRDDIGGLRFLLRSNNIVFEPLLAGVSGIGTNGSNVTNVALRGGVEKLTFLRLLLDSSTGQFLPLTNTFVDKYYIPGGTATQRFQTLQRVIARPDILFTARDLGSTIEKFGNSRWVYANRIVERSGTSDWQNHSALNSVVPLGLGGPGLITPGATITFSTLGKYVLGTDRGTPRSIPYLPQWASFGHPGGALVPHLGPAPMEGIVQLDIGRITIDNIPSIEWTLLGEIGRTYRVEYSTNLINWSAWYWKDNLTGIFTIDHPFEGSRRFFRVVKEPWPHWDEAASVD